MGREPLAALAELKSTISSTLAPTSEQLWDTIPGHSDTVNSHVYDILRSTIDTVAAPGGNSTQILPIVGLKGSGKTHAISWAGHYVQETGGVFIHFEPSREVPFWKHLCHKINDALRRPHARARTQRVFVLEQVTDGIELEPRTGRRLMDGDAITAYDIDALNRAIYRHHPHLSTDARRAALALAVSNSTDPDTAQVGEDYLRAVPASKTQVTEQWKLGTETPPPQHLATAVSELISTSSAMLLSIDQIDELVRQSASGTADQTSTQVDSRGEFITDLGDGLMDLRQNLHRAAIVMACQPHVWERFSAWASGTAQDRFHSKVQFQELRSAAAAEELVAGRFAFVFDRIGFTPAYATWPITSAAFEAVPRRFRPRQLLTKVRDHIDGCVRHGRITELESFELTEASEPQTPKMDLTAMASLDSRFNELRSVADVEQAFDKDREDTVVPDLLYEAFTCALTELGTHDWQVVKNRHSDAGQRSYSGWHVQLVREVDESSEAVEKYTVRTVTSNHWKAVQSRARRLATDAELDVRSERSRNAVLLRPRPWSRKPTYIATEEAFSENGGVILTPNLRDELRTFAALREMRKEASGHFETWLRDRRPASATAVVAAVLRYSADGAGAEADEGPDPPDGMPLDQPATSTDESADSRQPIVFGRDAESGTDIELDPLALAKHTAVFAGSGSGKTAMLRRLIEQCALRGVSVIALDPNNDLARLGDPWPEPPSSWVDGDAAAARRYLDGTDVVVWTPGRQTGRPVAFRALPDFTGATEDPDEYRLVIDSAVATLAPRAKVDGGTAKDEQRRAVLRSALHLFADKSPSGGLKEYLHLLGDFPQEASGIAKAPTIAHEMAQTLEAVRVNDPMFGGAGESLDPSTLLTPGAGKRARISVISLVGLPNERDRQGFVNQLQMALFSWAKRHPAQGRSLGGLYVMDEAQTFAPSSRTTPCTQSTIALASQARKYGLGLVFATQAPRGIHSQLVGNCATQLYGFLNTVAHVEAAREIARAKGGSVPDISRLSAGQFYIAGEGVPFRKSVVPMCLSHHPGSALGEEEVLGKASS